jgi:hypothetical protein
MENANRKIHLLQVMATVAFPRNHKPKRWLHERFERANEEFDLLSQIQQELMSECMRGWQLADVHAYRCDILVQTVLEFILLPSL